jgi:SET domain-containing protein
MKESNFDFVRDLKEKVFCRLAISNIHGVGVFAIRDIPAGVDPFPGEKGFCEFDEIPVSSIMESEDITPAVKKLVIDLCPERDGVYDIPNHSLNLCGVSWYINHSTSPNCGENDGDFFTLREIKAGEELTVDYGTYGKLNL